MGTTQDGHVDNKAMPRGTTGATSADTSSGGTRGIPTPVPGKSTEKGDSWVNLFKENRRISKGFRLIRHKNEDAVRLTSAVVEDVKKGLGHCLIGYIAGRFPELQAILELCNTWAIPYKCYTHSNGLLIFKFAKEEDKDRVLMNGPYFVFGRPLMLKELPEYFEFEENEFCLVPIWIKLPSLPLECWTAEALGMITSMVGNPISTDQVTAERGRISYARVLVEVDITKDLVDRIPIYLPNGKLRHQVVEFEYVPDYCPGCRKLGHKEASCKAGEEAKFDVKGRTERGRAKRTELPIDSGKERSKEHSGSVSAKKIELPNDSGKESYNEHSSFDRSDVPRNDASKSINASPVTGHGQVQQDDTDSTEEPGEEIGAETDEDNTDAGQGTRNISCTTEVPRREGAVRTDSGQGSCKGQNVEVQENPKSDELSEDECTDETGTETENLNEDSSDSGSESQEDHKESKCECWPRPCHGIEQHAEELVPTIVFEPETRIQDKNRKRDRPPSRPRNKEVVEQEVANEGWTTVGRGGRACRGGRGGRGRGRGGCAPS